MTSEWVTPEEAQAMAGMAFFEDKLERLLELVGSVVSTTQDEVWVSAHDHPPVFVHGATVLGMRVIVSWSVPAGEVWLWSCSRGELVT